MINVKSKVLSGLIAGALCIGSISVLGAETKITVQVGGKEVAFSNQQPQIISGTTYVPLRGVFEELGYEVKWDAASKIITLTSNNTTISLKQDSTYTLNNEQKALENKILTLQGSTMLPLREVSTLVGAKVDWNAATKTVIITNGSLADVPADVPVDVPTDVPTDISNDDVMNDPATIKAQAMHRYVAAMKKRTQSLDELADKYGIEMHFTDIAKEDIPNFLKDYKVINSADIEAVKTIEADEDFQDVKDTTVKLITKCSEVMEMYLIDNVEDGPETVKMVSEIAVKKAIMAYCDKSGLDATTFFAGINEEDSYSDIVKFY